MSANQTSQSQGVYSFQRTQNYWVECIRKALSGCRLWKSPGHCRFPYLLNEQSELNMVVQNPPRILVAMAAPCLAVAATAPENIELIRHKKTLIPTNTTENLWHNNGRVIYDCQCILNLCVSCILLTVCWNSENSGQPRTVLPARPSGQRSSECHHQPAPHLEETLHTWQPGRTNSEANV